jgi:hypothetical protein
MGMMKRLNRQYLFNPSHDFTSLEPWGTAAAPQTVQAPATQATAATLPGATLPGATLFDAQAEIQGSLMNTIPRVEHQAYQQAFRYW